MDGYLRRYLRVLSGAGSGEEPYLWVETFRKLQHRRSRELSGRDRVRAGTRHSQDHENLKGSIRGGENSRDKGFKVEGILLKTITWGGER